MPHLSRSAFTASVLLGAIALSSCNPTTAPVQPAAAVDNRDADEAAIRAADAAWSKAAGEKDLARTV